ERQAVRIIEGGPGVRTGFEDEDGLARGGEYVRGSAAARAAPDDADVEPRERAVAEDAIVVAAHHRSGGSVGEGFGEGDDRLLDALALGRERARDDGAGGVALVGVRRRHGMVGALAILARGA